MTEKFIFDVLWFFIISLLLGAAIIFLIAKFSPERKIFEKISLVVQLIILLGILLIPGILYLILFNKIIWQVTIIVITWIIGFFVGFLIMTIITEGPLVVDEEDI